MKRVYVYNNKSECDGKVIAIDESSKFLQNVSSTLNITAENIKLYASNGCEITDTRVLRDEEKVYLSTESNITSRNCDKHDDKRSKSCAVSDWITLNVGGKHFLTTRSTLLGKEPQSMLGRMFAEENNQMNPSAIDATGAYLIDRSPEYFEPILNYLRHGEVILDKHVNPRGVYEEAVFYGIESMIPILNDLMVLSRTGPHSNNQVLTRLDVIKLIFSTPTTSKLRFQGVNLTGADLTKLDLSNINFKYANMARCNLSGANLSHCCLERADLSQANLEGAQLIGVKASCANMEGANLKGCNMEDPAGLKACLDGVNLKGANLEGSNMAGVNLRVATLKNANLQNCDLRTAVFAGADLESCDLSGSDLHEANLRGANLRDAAFELMLTPLHMSQTVR